MAKWKMAAAICMGLTGFGQEPRKIGDWNISDSTSRMDGKRTIVLLAGSGGHDATLAISCTSGRIGMAFVSSRGFRLGDVDCNPLTNGTQGWLGGGRCVTQTFVRWRYNPAGILNTYWIELDDSAEIARFDTLWRKQIGMIADSSSIRVQFTGIDGKLNELEFGISGLREALPELAPAGCRVSVKSKKK